MLTLLYGRAGCGGSNAILRRIREHGKSRPQVLLVPEQASHETERALCRVCGDGASLYAEVLSFTRLANRVFAAEGGLARPVLDPGGRLLLLYTAVDAVADKLTVYARPSRRPAFLSGLQATVDELKTGRVTPQALEEAAEDAQGQSGDKLRDLALLCGAYEAMTARGAMDPRDRLTRLEETLRQTRWGAGMDFYCDGFTDFTPQEKLVLRALLARGNSLTVALTCDRLEGGPDGVFGPARHTAAQLGRMAKECGSAVVHEKLALTEDVRTPLLAFWENTLFEGKSPRWTGETQSVELFSAQTPRGEVEWAAARIRELCRTRGYRCRDIAVCARNMEGYGDLIERIFPRYGIPVFLSRQRPILEKPILTLVTAALDAVAGDYSYADLFRYLKTGLTDLSAEEVDLLENYALKWNLRGSRWTAQKDWTMHPAGYGKTLTEEDAALLDRLNALRRKVTAPLERLRRSGARTPRAHATALYRLMEEVGLSPRLEERTQRLEALGEMVLAQEYRQLWTIVTGGLEQFARLPEGRAMDLAEFSKLFPLLLSQYDVGAIPVALDRVTAGEMPRIANKRVKVLVVLGAEDDAIPQVAPAAGLLDDDDRAVLAARGWEVSPRMGEKLDRELTILYQAWTQPEEALLITWPRTGAEGEEKRPCFLIGRMTAAAPELTVRREDCLAPWFRLIAPEPALEQAGKYPAVRAMLAQMPAYAHRVRRLEEAAAVQRGQLSPAASQALYGNRVALSATRLDRYRSCHFSYFLRYGLKAEPRTPAGFETPEYGTFLHAVLEEVLQCAQALPGGIGALEPAAMKAMTRNAVERYAREELGGLEDQTPRFRYLFHRLLTTVEQVVENVVEELKASDFTPIAFELGFGAKGELPPVEFEADGVTVSVSGFVDRVDGWVKDGKLYLRVVDYKTGRKSFDLTEVWNGLGLQMLLYLFTLQREGVERFGRTVAPAGVLYLPARTAVLAGSRTMTDEARKKALDKALCRRGLVLDDPAVLAAMEHTGPEGHRFLPLRVSRSGGSITGEALVSAQRLGRLDRHIGRILNEICGELASGNIDADPFWRGAEKNACRYCDYAAACHFEEGVGSDRRRWFPTVSPQEFWDALERGGDEDGLCADK